MSIHSINLNLSHLLLVFTTVSFYAVGTAVPIPQGLFQKAAQEWCTDPNAAWLSEYGDISSWDTSDIVGMFIHSCCLLYIFLLM